MFLMMEVPLYRMRVFSGWGVIPMDFCITQLQAHGPSRTCIESNKEEEEEGGGGEEEAVPDAGENRPLDAVRGFRSPQILGCYVTKCAPHLALKLTAWGTLTFDERDALHRVG